MKDIYLYIYICFGYSFADSFKTMERKVKRKNSTKNKDEGTIDFEECTNFESNATFYQMNLSRPLLKVCNIIIII